jgi:hypothetical protein
MLKSILKKCYAKLWRETMSMAYVYVWIKEILWFHSTGNIDTKNFGSDRTEEKTSFKSYAHRRQESILMAQKVEPT